MRPPPPKRPAAQGVPPAVRLQIEDPQQNNWMGVALIALSRMLPEGKAPTDEEADAYALAAERVADRLSRAYAKRMVEHQERMMKTFGEMAAVPCPAPPCCGDTTPAPAPSSTPSNVRLFPSIHQAPVPPMPGEPDPG